MTTRTLDTPQGGDEIVASGQTPPPPINDIVGAYRVLGELGRGGMGVVYRAVHTASGQPAAIKMVIDCNRPLLAALRAEVIALQQVKHPYIVSVLDEGLSDTVPWYAMDFIDGFTLASFNADLWRNDQPSPGEPTGIPEPSASRRPIAAGKLAEVLQSYCKLCDALMHVHAEGIVHRDLKPSNVMLRADATPVLMDFGIASRAFGKTGRDQLDLNTNFMGSALYTAPEQIRGESVDPRADLYSFGCMLYETLTSRPPFVLGGPRQILNKHLHEAPLPASQLVDGVPSELDRLLLSLLAKSPRERIGHSDDVMTVLLHFAPSIRQVSGRAASNTPPHLYRPGIAGRQDVLQQLRAHLDMARQGRGKAVFVEGESGIGKTFLASEAARQAGLQAVQVVTGTCVSIGVESGSEDLHRGNLQAFRGMLQTLADRCREGGHAFFAPPLKDAIAILSPYEPALEPFSYGPAHETRGLPPEAARLRIFSALADALSACAIEVPLLLILDDLHWADELSLNFLESLPEGFFEDKPILLLCLFRPEEATKSLRTILQRPDIARLQLSRLSQDAVLSIVSDMLAMPSPPGAFIRFLVRRSEGNPFFAGEYLRLFAEERILRRQAGAWVFGETLETEDSLYERLDLPWSVKEVVARRLRHLRAEDRTLVETASVIGREFDLDTLSTTMNADPASLAGGLRELERKGLVVETSPGRHRFAHEYLRAVAYEQISVARRPLLHMAAGLALEQQQESLREAHSAELAYHFKEAGERVKAIAYLEKAVSHAVSTFANREATRLFRELLDLSEGDVGHEAILRRARWERGLGDALHGDGQLEASRTHLQNSLRLLGHLAPPGGRRLALATIGQLLEQAARRIVRGYGVDPPSRETTPAQEAAQAYDRLLQIFYYRGSQLEMLHATLKTLNLSERGGPSPELARAYAIAHAVAGVIPLRSLAETYLEHATGILQKTPDPSVESYLLLLTGGYRAGIAEWELARLAFDRGLKIAMSLRFHRRCDEIRLGLENQSFLLGRFDATRGADNLPLSARRGDPQAHVWRVLMRAQACLAQGAVEDATRLAHEAEGLLPDLQRSERIWTFAVLSATALRRGALDMAYQFATKALDQISAGPPVTFYCIEAYSTVCDVYQSLWGRARLQGSTAAELPNWAERACRALRAFARIFPAAGPRSALHDGILHDLHGRRARAAACWERSLRIAIALRMPYDEVVARWHLVSVSGEVGARRQERLTVVLRAAQALGATTLVARVREDLDHDGPGWNFRR